MTTTLTRTDTDLDDVTSPATTSEAPAESRTMTAAEEYRDLVTSLPDLMDNVERTAAAREQADRDHDVAKQRLADGIERHNVLVQQALPKAFTPPAVPARPARRRSTGGPSSDDYKARIATRKRNQAIRAFAREHSLACPETGSDFSPDLIAAFDRDGGYQG